MGKAHDQDLYPLQTVANPLDTIYGYSDLLKKDVNFSANLLAGAGSILQNNIVKVVTTKIHTSGDVWDNINATDFGIGVTTSPTTYYTVGETDNIIFRVPSVNLSANLAEIRYNFYLLAITGKGKYGVGGDISLEKEHLFWLRDDQAVNLPSTLSLPPVIHTFYDQNIDDPETTLNAQTGSFVIDPAVRDNYIYIIKPSVTVAVGDEASALYLFIGSAGDYGNSASPVDVAIPADFQTIQINNDVNATQKITVRKIVVGAVINGTGIPDDNIALAVNRSFRGLISISPDEIVLFEAHHNIPSTTVGGAYSVWLEKYIWKNGVAVLNGSTVEADYELMFERNITGTVEPPPTASADQEVFALGWTDIDAPHDALNAETASYVLDKAVSDALFIVYEVDVDDCTYKIYKFDGDAGNYGNSASPVDVAVLGDFIEIIPLKLSKSKITHTSDLKNDGEGVAGKPFITGTIETDVAYVDDANGDDGTGAFGDRDLPFKTVANALASFPTPTAPQEALYNKRIFTVHILDDVAQTINVFTEHNIRFYCESGAQLTLDHTGTGFGQTNFGADSAIFKQIIFDMPRSTIVFKKITAGNAVETWTTWSHVHLRVQKVKCETIDPINYGLFSGYITGQIIELECDKSGLKISPREFANFAYVLPRELNIVTLKMNNTTVTGQNEIAINLDCVGVEFFAGAGELSFNVNIKIATGTGTGKTSAIRSNGRLNNWVKFTFNNLTNIRIFDKLCDTHIHFDNAFLSDVCVGTVDLSTSFGGANTSFTGLIAMFHMDGDTYTRFNLYDHICYTTPTTDGHTFRWNVTIADFRLDNPPADPKLITLFHAPDDLRTIVNTVNDDEVYSGLIMVDAKFYNCPVRIFGTGKASVTKVGNPTTFEAEKLVFFGDCVFEGNGEFLILSTPSNEKRIVVRGSFAIGEDTVWNTALNLELETKTTTPADVTL